MDTSDLFEKVRTNASAQQFIDALNDLIIRNRNIDVELLQYFLNLKNEEGDTLLHVAARNGSFEMVKVLLGLGLALNEPNFSDQYAYPIERVPTTAEHYADIITLLRRSPSQHIYPVYIYRINNRPMRAVYMQDLDRVFMHVRNNNGDLDSFIARLNAFIDVNRICELNLLRFFLQKSDGEGNTLMHLAAQNGNIQLLYELMHFGLATNYINHYNENPVAKVSQDHPNHAAITSLLETGEPPETHPLSIQIQQVRDQGNILYFSNRSLYKSAPERPVVHVAPEAAPSAGVRLLLGALMICVMADLKAEGLSFFKVPAVMLLFLALCSIGAQHGAVMAQGLFARNRGAAHPAANNVMPRPA